MMLPGWLSGSTWTAGGGVFWRGAGRFRGCLTAGAGFGTLDWNMKQLIKIRFSGYWWRLTFERSWVRIPAPNTGLTFLPTHWFAVKIILYWKTENKWKRGQGWSIFFKKKILLSSIRSVVSQITYKINKILRWIVGRTINLFFRWIVGRTINLFFRWIVGIYFSGVL